MQSSLAAETQQKQLLLHRRREGLTVTLMGQWCAPLVAALFTKVTKGTDQQEAATTIFTMSTNHAIEAVRSVAGRVGFKAVAPAVLTLSILIVMASPLPRWLGWPVCLLASPCSSSGIRKRRSCTAWDVARYCMAFTDSRLACLDRNPTTDTF